MGAKVVQALLARGEPRDLLREKDKKYGRTPLHDAAMKGDAAMVKALLGDLQQDTLVRDLLGEKDKCGWTPLHHCFSGFRQDAAVVKALLANLNSEQIHQLLRET